MATSLIDEQSRFGGIIKFHCHSTGP